MYYLSADMHVLSLELFGRPARTALLVVGFEVGGAPSELGGGSNARSRCIESRCSHRLTMARHSFEVIVMASAHPQQASLRLSGSLDAFTNPSISQPTPIRSKLLLEVARRQPFPFVYQFVGQ